MSEVGAMKWSVVVEFFPQATTAQVDGLRYD